MAVVQMNVRMDKALKEGGDAALARAGFTPTQAVRVLWQFARDNVGDLGRVQGVLESLGGGGVQAVPGGASDFMAEAAAIQQRRANLYQELGIEQPAAQKLAGSESFEDALQRQVEKDRASLALAYEERNAERGL